MSTRRLVVGVDDTSQAQLALRWAVGEADRRRVPMRVVSVYPASAHATLDDERAHSVMRERFDEAVAYVSDRLGHDQVSGVFVTGNPASILLNETSDASMLVVGSRSRGTAGSLLLGSVSSAVAAHAWCPVVVVHSRDDSPAPIVVGIDGSTGSDRALKFAFEESLSRGVPLDVVHCWEQVGYIDPAVWTDGHVVSVAEKLRQWLTDTTAAMRERYPDVEVRERLVEGPPSLVLADLSDDASIVVVGSRGHGGVAGLLLGSVSQSVLHHAHCTVAVVR